MAVNGIAVAAGSAGVIFLWGALHNKSVLQTLKDVISGKQPQGAPEQAATVPANVASSSATAPLIGTGTYSESQLRALWVMAGGSQATAQNAACHAMQESSGNASVTSSNPDGGINVGLWQLDTKGVGAGHTVAQLQDAMTNARITVSATKNGVDWSSWATPGC